MSYEKDSKNENNADIGEKLSISLMRFFWETSPLTKSRKVSLSNFLRDLKLFKHLTDREIWILSKFLHVRSFSDNEVIFRQNDLGVGFYIIQSGRVRITNFEDGDGEKNYSVYLEKNDHFGEMAVLEEGNYRTASAESDGRTTCLVFLRPDLDDLIKFHPVVAAKFIQAAARALTHRFYGLMDDMNVIYKKLKQEEGNNEHSSN